MSGKYSSSSLSRASSTNSLHNANLNGVTGQNTDDEDSESVFHGTQSAGRRGNASRESPSVATMSPSYKERRREAHTAAEQKRRDAIKKGYDYLQDLIPSSNSNSTASSNTSDHQEGKSADMPNHKVSKATVLQKAIDYIQFVQQQKVKQEDELAMLKKEVVALQIMRSNYEQLVRAHQSQPTNHEAFVPSEVKFQTFQLLMDNLFQSFNEQVGMNDFTELSRCVFSWLEEQCKPQLLQELMCNILQQVRLNYEKQQQLQQRLQQVSRPAHGGSNFQQ